MAYPKGSYQAFGSTLLAFCHRGVIFILGLLLSFKSHAIELFDNVQIHGFASQALILTSGNNLFGSSISNPSLDFTELGINGSWSPSPNLRLSMQVLSRRAGSWSDGTPVIDFGLLDYSHHFDQDYRLGIRAGRVRQPYGIYNDTRDVAFTRPSILLPQSIYLETVRDFSISGDGLLIYGESRKPWGNLTLELSGGYPRTGEVDNQFAFSPERLPGSLEPNLSFDGRLNYQTYDGSLRLALSGFYTSANYKPSNGNWIEPITGKPRLEPKGGLFAFNSMLLSAQYNTENWTLTSEYSPHFFQGTGLNTLDNPFRNFNNFGQSYYFQAAYRFAPQWELMARYDAAYPNSHDQSGQATEAKYQNLVNHSIANNPTVFDGYAGAVKAYNLRLQLPPAYSQFAKTLTVGIRYDLTPTIMLRAEYNYINGTAWLPAQDNPRPAETAQYWNMFGFLVSLRF